MAKERGAVRGRGVSKERGAVIASFLEPMATVVVLALRRKPKAAPEAGGDGAQSLEARLMSLGWRYRHGKGVTVLFNSYHKASIGGGLSPSVSERFGDQADGTRCQACPTCSCVNQHATSKGANEIIQRSSHPSSQLHIHTCPHTHVHPLSIEHGDTQATCWSLNVLILLGHSQRRAFIRQG